jgi:hypothetical protein
MKGNKSSKRQLSPPQANTNTKDINESPTSSSLLKSVLLSLIFLVLVFFIRKIESYSFFYENKIKGGYEEIAQIKDIENYEDIEIRKQLRWGGGYQLVKQITSYIKDSNALVLQPPKAYIDKINSKFGLPEPSVTYYFSGLKTCWGNAKNVYKCTHAYIVTPNGADILKINNKGQIDSLLLLYKPYPYSL